MAIQSLCAKIFGGQDSSCNIQMRKYYQQAVVINKSDIETILSLYVKLIPQNQCEICGKESSFIDKLNKLYECPHMELDEIMRR